MVWKSCTLAVRIMKKVFGHAAVESAALTLGAHRVELITESTTDPCLPHLQLNGEV